ncbi:hypothetical protein EHQ53_03065 [Leptospira langatensis]|uniref:Uncharacterized protein n=1 Tax=Leptospira langatensis TaxID=2484983 RepID=A0A5F1ZZZ0_9LEPT|nr:hypothetical protein [Leptospira langatensis]TGK04143.1 hypothetical protein EHO57_03295 [Leptospira langatensis]TGL43623.1 hypothetical protein EHQ53_03065 [Leptospira langatensis]
MKVYSAERVPNSTDYNLYITEGNSKTRLILSEPSLPGYSELSINDKVLKSLAYSILLNYTQDREFSNRNTNRFLNFLSDIVHRDSWFFLANRVEQFIKDVESFGVEISYDF